MIQTLSTEEQRRRVLGLCSCLSYAAIILGNLLFLIGKKIGIPSHQVFFVSVGLCEICVVPYSMKWKRIFEVVLQHSTGDLATPAEW